MQLEIDPDKMSRPADRENAFGHDGECSWKSEIDCSKMLV
jgi:hypothetical protein